ncbi:MAG: hypothetical protein R3E86_15230 [Pseudomonadales bacterium]
MDDENYHSAGEDTVQDWIVRAKRAHELVGKVDLGKIASHDADELRKLSAVTGALESLSAGDDVEFLAGVDEDEITELDPLQMRRANLLAVLDAAGFGDRLGRVYAVGEDASLRPLDLIPHQQGLPEFDLCIAPEHAPAGSAQGIFVSERGVFIAMIPEPVTRHKWRIVRSRPYDDEQEMLATIRRFMTRSVE